MKTETKKQTPINGLVGEYSVKGGILTECPAPEFYRGDNRYSNWAAIVTEDKTNKYGFKRNYLPRYIGTDGYYIFNNVKVGDVLEFGLNDLLKYSTKFYYAVTSMYDNCVELVEFTTFLKAKKHLSNDTLNSKKAPSKPYKKPRPYFPKEMYNGETHIIVEEGFNYRGTKKKYINFNPDLKIDDSMKCSIGAKYRGERAKKNTLQLLKNAILTFNPTIKLTQKKLAELSGKNIRTVKRYWEILKAEIPTVTKPVKTNTEEEPKPKRPRTTVKIENKNYIKINR